MKSEKKIFLEVGEKIKKLRLKKGYKSYESFAFENDLPRAHYWKVEKGLTNITLKSLLRILEIHKITLEDFFSNNF